MNSSPSPVVRYIGHDMVALGEFAGQYATGQRVFYETLDGAAQRPRAECPVVALACEPVSGAVGEFDRDAVFSESAGDLGDVYVHNLADLVFGEWVEDDGRVEAV